jgi:hypothetical protein
VITAFNRTVVEFEAMGTRGDGSALGRELWPPPGDGITNLRFSDHSDRLLVSSWDAVSAAATLALHFLMLFGYQSVN